MLTKIMQEAVETGVFHAGELLVGKSGKEIFHMRAGAAKTGTHFDIASLTKPICTASIAKILLSKGLLKLDDTVYDWCGGARLSHHRLMTIEMLLNHISGLPAWQPYFAEQPISLAGTDEGRRSMLLSCYNEPIINTPGKKTVYSDIGYIILGEIIEQAGSDTLDNLFKKYISKPLGLNDTFFVKIRLKTENKKQPPLHFCRSPSFAPTEDCPWRGRIISGEVDDQNAYAMGGVAGHAGLFSTAKDIHKFINEFLKSYRGKSHFLPTDELRLLIDFSKKKKNCSEIYLGGWNLPSTSNSSSGHHFSNMSIGHLGYTGCSMWIDIEKDFCVILLTNRVHPTSTNQKIKSFRPKLHDLVYKELIKI